MPQAFGNIFVRGGGIGETATASRWLISLSSCVEMVELKHDHVFHSKVRRYLGREAGGRLFSGVLGAVLGGGRRACCCCSRWCYI